MPVNASHASACKKNLVFLLSLRLRAYDKINSPETVFMKFKHPSLLRYLPAILLFCLPVVLYALSHFSRTFDIFRDTGHYTVVLDAGHGGSDPGKVSVSGI